MKTALRTLCLLTAISIGGWLAEYAAVQKDSLQLSNDRVVFPPLFLTRPEVISLATLGHRGFYNDVWMIWITQLINPLSPVLELEDFLKLSQSILMHQPESERIYVAFCYYAVENYNRPDFCENYSQVGIKLFPQSWVLAISQGYVYGFYLKDLGRASAFYALAASRPNAPAYAQLLAEKFKRNDNVTEADYKITVEILRRFTGNSELGNKDTRVQP